jgi:photosystem II stability/assembly factor-like uncharacterized protein
MKKIFCFLIFLSSFNTNLFSQPGVWQLLQSSPSVSISDFYFLSNGLNGWSVGAAGASGNYVSVVCATTNGGTNWTSVTLNSVNLSGIWFANSQVGWAVGSGGTILYSSNGGLNWTQQTSPINRLLAKVCFINAQTGWATGGWQDGSSFPVIKTTNGGQNWTDQSFGSTAYSCESIHFINDQTGWVGGRDNTLAPHIHKTTDGGTTWTRQTVPSTGSNVGILSIKFANINKGWAASTSIYNNGPVFYTSDGGSNWVIQYSTNMHYHVLDVRDSMSVAVVGVRVLSPAEQVFVTTNGGANWTSNTPPIIGYTYGISYRGNNVWIGSNNTQILLGSNNGATWVTQFIAPRWRSVAWSSPTTGWITAGTNVGTDGVCLKTTDGGTSWSKDLVSPGGSQVCFVNTNYGWMMFEGNNASIYRTSNGGNSWIQTYIPSSGAWIGRITFASQNTGWAYGSTGKIVYTTNSGVAWTAQNVGSSNYIDAVFSTSENEAWAGGGYGGGSGFISHTTNSGQNWTLQIPATSAMVNDFYFINNMSGWALNFGGTSQKTTDGGHTWTASGSVPNSYAQRIVMIDSLRGWIAAYNSTNGGGNGLGYIYKTINGGDSWIQEWVTPLVGTDLSDLVKQNNSTLWCVGNNSSIVKYDIPVGIHNISSEIPSGFSLSQNYPNPFNPVTKIKFSLIMDSRFRGNDNVVLKVFDILGKEVATLVNEKLQPGTYEVSFDGSQLTSGVYFYKISAGDFTETKKLLLIK